MPEIEITEDQRERLRAVREDLEADVVGKYGHVRVVDAVEYLLDRYESDAETAGPDAATTAGTGSAGESATAETAGDGDGDSKTGMPTAAKTTTGPAPDADLLPVGAAAADGSGEGAPDDGDVDEGDGGPDEGDAAATGADDAELDAMMSLLDEYGDRWRDADGSDARYEVELPDGTVERARTKDDVRGLLFEHYR